MSVALLLPLVSVFRHAEVSWTFKALVVLTAFIAGLTPAIGTIGLAVLLPLALAFEILLGPLPVAAAISDCLAFAFVAGASWRVAAHDPSHPDRLARPALLFGAIVVTSMIVSLAVRKAVEPAYPLGQELWWHVTRTYFFEPQRLGEVNVGLRWVGTLLLAVFVERILRRTPALGWPTVRMWLIGGVAASSFALLRLAEVTLTRRVDPDPWTSLILLWQRVRITALHTDLNAAGSYFAVFLTAVLVLGVLYRRGWLLLGVGPPVLIAFAFTQSRAAFGGVLVVVAVLSVMTLVRRRQLVLAATAGLLLAGVFGATWIATHSTHRSGQMALAVRTEMLTVGLAMIREHPLVGVGIGRFLPASRRLITEDLPTLYQHYRTGENAHNNYLQIAAELGLPALAVFVWLMASLWWPRPQQSRPAAFPAERTAVAAGIAAFLVSALAGHPLLIPQVAAAFFFALGLAAGLAPPLGPAGRTARWITWMAVGLLIVSLPWRLATL